MENEQNNLIDLRKIFTAKVPKLMKYMPNWLFRKIQRLLHEDDINEILTKYADKEGIDFINAVVDDFNLKVVVEGEENLMASDRILVASNHPLGGLDGIALIGAVGNRRGETLTPVNDFLMFVKNLRPIFIPVSKVGSATANREESLKSARARPMAARSWTSIGRRPSSPSRELISATLSPSISKDAIPTSSTTSPVGANVWVSR